MDYEELRDWLRQQVEQGRMDPEQVEDVLAQRRRFDEIREGLESEPPGRVVGVVAGETVVDDDVSSLLDRCREQFGDRLVYFEPVVTAEPRPTPTAGLGL